MRSITCHTVWFSCYVFEAGDGAMSKARDCPILLYAFYYCVPFSPCNCHWHGEIPAFASTVSPGSWHVTEITRCLYPVPFCYLWNPPHRFLLFVNRKLPPPPPRVQFNFYFSLLLLLAGDVSLNPGSVVRGLCLGVFNAHSMQDKMPTLSVTLSPVR